MVFLYSPSRTLQYLYVSQHSPDLSSRFYPNPVLCLQCVAVVWSLSPDCSAPTSLTSSQPWVLLAPFLVRYPTDCLAGLPTEIISAFFPDSAGRDFMLYFCSSSISGYALQRAPLPCTKQQGRSLSRHCCWTPCTMPSNKARPLLLTNLCRPLVGNPNQLIKN